MPKKKYRPVPVAKLLKQMQNICSLILDLAYSTVIFQSPKLQKEVYRLEVELDSLVMQLEIQIMLATRDLEDAEANISFLRIGQALNRISDAAADIASIFSLNKAGLPEIVRTVIEQSDEPISRIRIRPECWLGLFYKGIDQLEEFFGLDLMALHRDKWIFSRELPKVKTLMTQDRLIVRGPLNALNVLKKTARGHLLSEDEILSQLEEKVIEIPIIKFDSPLERKIVQKLLKLKDKSELSINLAFSALLLNDKQLANEVMRLEKELDHLDRSLGLQALTLKSETIEQQERIWNLIRLSKALEEIADAGSWLIEPFRLDVELHPLLKDIVQEPDEKISLYEVSEDSEAVNTTINEFELAVLGMWVVAVHRVEKGYLFDPPENYKIKANDTLIIRAYGKNKRRIKLFEEGETDT
ncbi:MAG: potassium channel family protein [Candidatus Hodarchaeales archaeon]|jgi:uncharacterized protein with PhoU and TrkA domain